MQSLITQEWFREVEGDRLRMTGYRSRIARRRRDRRSALRATVGNGLIAAGERLRGRPQQVGRVATVTPLRRP